MPTLARLVFLTALFIGLLTGPLALRSHTWVVGGRAAVQNNGAAAFLQNVFGFSGRALQDAGNGTPAVLMLDSDDPREIGAVGVIGVPISPAVYLERLANIEDFKRAEAVRQVGKFRSPPGRADVQHLALENSDVRDLRDCRLHDCDVQLPAATIQTITGEDWRATDAQQRARHLLQDLLLDQARAYARGDPDGAMVYMHRPSPVSAADEFRSLVDDDRGALPQLPSLRRRLLATGLEPDDFLYWSREKIARKVVLSLTHVVIVRQPHPHVAYAIGSKQLYASHYFYASLGLTLLLRDESRPDTTFVVYMNRSRVDAFEGWFGGIVRRFVRSRASSAMRDHLARLRQRLVSATS
jgi:hypothetical protein